MSSQRPQMENEDIPMPRIAGPRQRSQYDYRVPDEIDRPKTLTDWLWPISGWIYMLVNSAIICGTGYKMIVEGYYWATHLSLVIGFGSSFAITAAINRYIVKEFKDVRRDN